MKRTAIIIGAGVGGLGMAALLAADGWSVDVYEQSSQAGGRAGSWSKDGFRFDTGPSWYLMPEVFEHFFNLIGEKRSNYYDLIRLNPAYKVFTESTDSIIIHGDLSHDKKTFERIEPGSADALTLYLAQAEETYKLALRYFLYNPFTKLRSVITIPIIRKFPFMLKQLFRPIHRYVQSYVKTQVLQQILEYPMVFLGASPYQAPSLYHLMSYMDFCEGVYFPKGGMYKIVEGLEKVAIKKGARFHYNQPVQRILHSRGKATGIELADGSVAKADLVISNADLHFTETALLDASVQTYPEKYWKRKIAGPSALLLYLGVKGSLPQLEHHNLLFVDDWEKNFSDIFKTKSWPSKASIYLSRTTATDRSAGPKGCENIFVLVPLPAGASNVDQTDYIDRYLQQIEQMTGVTDLRQRITVQRAYGPQNFKDDFNAWQGTALGMSHVLKQSAMFRPSVKSKKLDNLFYVGAGTQPGIGIPMCLISAELVYKRLINDSTAGPLEKLGGSHV